MINMIFVNALITEMRAQNSDIVYLKCRLRTEKQGFKSAKLKADLFLALTAQAANRLALDRCYLNGITQEKLYNDLGIQRSSL